MCIDLHPYSVKRSCRRPCIRPILQTHGFLAARCLPPVAQRANNQCHLVCCILAMPVRNLHSCHYAVSSAWPVIHPLCIMQRCARVSRALEAGIVWINCSQPAFLQAPWGGTKNSGYGRELGEWGLDAYTSLKQVTAYVSENKWDWYPEMGPLTTKVANGVA